MHGVAQRIGNYIAREMTNPEVEDVISYGAEIVLGSFFQLVLILGIAVCLGIFEPVSTALFSAMIYRIFSGGAHCTGYYRCLIVSVITFIPLGYLALQLAYFQYNSLIIIIGTLFILILTIKWAPAENPKHPISGKNKRYKLKIICLILIAIFIVMSVGNGTGTVISSIFTGLLWQTLTITPLGTVWLHRADRLLSMMATFFKERRG
jgi:Membrane protein putatively involved in post-translational modification of the autoinducing quorum-sensing peptide